MAEMKQRLLMLVDARPSRSRLTSALIAREGWRTVVAETGERALAMLGTHDGMALSAVLVDERGLDDDACLLITDLRQRCPSLPILMVTGSPSPLLAVEAMRAGATDYLIDPVAPDRLLKALRLAGEHPAPRDELTPLSEKLHGDPDFNAMIGTSPPFRDALAKAAKAARGHDPVLIEGERGTGKEMLVRAMIAASPRAKAPFHILNVRSISASSMESALFGHERNAFAGAFDRKTGLLAKLDGGTVVLDEVDRLSLDMQQKLAEALTTGRVRPIGAAHAYKIDLRVIATSNQPLAELAARGKFRPDLLLALAGSRIILPALRDRPGDIAALARHFLSRMAEQPGLQETGITEPALKLLAGFDWPGNVRQLQATLFRAAVFCQGEAITPRDLPQLAEIVGDKDTDEASAAPQGAGVQIYMDDGNLRPLDEIEADVIRLAIGHYRGRMAEVARRLGIGRSTLYRKLGDLGIDNAA